MTFLLKKPFYGTGNIFDIAVDPVGQLAMEGWERPSRIDALDNPWMRIPCDHKSILCLGQHEL